MYILRAGVKTRYAFAGVFACINTRVKFAQGDITCGSITRFLLAGEYCVRLFCTWGCWHVLFLCGSVLTRIICGSLTRYAFACINTHK